MFRPMRRIGQALSAQEIDRVLAQAMRGVLAVHGEDGYPYAFPMDFLYADDKLYFHCAKVGHKLDALAADGRASFCVMDEGYRREGEWALNIKSVVLFGRVSTVDDPDRAEDIARRLGLKYHPTPESVEVELEKALDRVLILEMSVDHMTGKLVNES